MRYLTLIALAAASLRADLVPEVRALLSAGNLQGAEAHVRAFQAHNGATPEMIEGFSWLGRGALAMKRYDEAQRYAADTKKLALEALKKRPLDAEPRLPTALGAAIEVTGNAMAAQGARSEAVAYLQTELAAYRSTSIRARIQKNIHLLSLEGKPGPALEKVNLAALRGKPAVLFFWAHWCSDCKMVGPVLARLKQQYPDLQVIGLTQLYGYIQGGQDATPDQELKYIEEIRKLFYADLMPNPSPVSSENFKRYGSSSSPTLVLLDRQGLVRFYNPGAIGYDDLSAKIAAVYGKKGA